jgi:AcrR family transcriptional regulator
MELSTQTRILRAGKQEFLSKGFHAASLRDIAKSAGVTTGAFYGYFKSKDDLFETLVGDVADTFIEKFEEVQHRFSNLPPQEQPNQMGTLSQEYLTLMVDYIYQHFESFQLILSCSKGTQYEHFIDRIVEIEVAGTNRFLSVLRKLGHEVVEIDPQLEHILVSGLFTSFFEFVIHNMPKHQAVDYVNKLNRFYIAGWREIMGL